MRLLLQKRIRILGYLAFSASMVTVVRAQNRLAVVAKNERSIAPSKSTLRTDVTSSVPVAIVIKGKVTAQEDRLALPDVNISIKGTTIGTTTNAEGNYIISVPSKESTLTFSFLGYVSQEISVDDQTAINVTLAADSKVLNELVVSALGFKEEKDRLGSTLSTVKPEDITGHGPVA